MSDNCPSPNKVSQEELKIWIAITECRGDIKAAKEALTLETGKVEERLKNRIVLWVGAWTVLLLISEIIIKIVWR